jgi:hypothetical protein
MNEEVYQFVLEVNRRFGPNEGFTAADFFSRADELDLVSDLVRILRYEHGDSVALFAAGWFGGSGDLPKLREKNDERKHT